MKNIGSEMWTARLISLLAHPLNLLILALVLGNFDLIREGRTEFFIFLILGSFLPLIVYLYYLDKHKTKLLTYASIDRAYRQNIFLSIILSFSLVVVLFSYTNQDPVWISNAMLLVILFAVFFLVNKYIDKASIHTAAFSFAVIYLSGRVSMAFALLLFILPFVCWSRIELHKHTWFQLMLGSVLGMFIGLLAWTF